MEQQPNHAKLNPYLRTVTAVAALGLLTAACDREPAEPETHEGSAIVAAEQAATDDAALQTWTDQLVAKAAAEQAQAAIKARKEAAEKQAIIEKGPDLIDPKTLPPKQFVGAFVMHLNPDRSFIQQDPNMLAADAAYDSYYARHNQPRPEMQPTLVHRLVAGDATQENPVSNEMLSYGVVIDQRSSTNTLVLAMHNITPVTAPVQLNGQNYTETVMGANAINGPGDTFTIMRPSTVLPGYLETLTYAYDSYFIADADDASRLGEADPGGRSIAYTYKCTPAGSSAFRWVATWVLQDTSYEVGSVGDEGAVVLTHTNQ